MPRKTDSLTEVKMKEKKIKELRESWEYKENPLLDKAEKLLNNRREQIHNDFKLKETSNETRQ